MPKFKKKPIEIEARQLKADSHTHKAICEWLEANGTPAKCWGKDEGYCVDIYTLEGFMRAHPGDWIIRGVKGEFYPCKPDIFEMTYESIPSHDDTVTHSMDPVIREQIDSENSSD